MFQVTFFCDDKKLGDALRGLTNIAHGAPEVLPVTNVEAGRGGKLIASSNGTSASQFLHYIRKRKLREVNASIAADFLKSSGRSEASKTYLLKETIKLGGLKKIGKGMKTTYRVVPQ